MLSVTLSTGLLQTEVLLGHGLLAQASDLLRNYYTARLMLVSDEHVAPLYAAPLQKELTQAGYDVHLLTMGVGEKAKTLDTLSDLYTRCQALLAERGDVVVAVGGGVVGDVAGMLAGTYLRGLEFVQVPTSLVAQISASVGGKVGVNFKDYKNLVGLFKPPSVVLADLTTLLTLPPLEFRSGLGELVTVGVVGAPEIFERLELEGAQNLETLVAAAIRCKGALVEADPFDRRGIRAKLNLGHTFGHALEKLSNFTLPHGLAVAVGLHIAGRLAAALGLCSEQLVNRIRNTLSALDLPTVLRGYRPAQVIEVMRTDKKRSGNQMHLVLPLTLGQVILVSEDQVPSELLIDVLHKVIEEGSI